MSDDPLETARRALEPGETLIWADRPSPEALARTKLPQVIRGVLGLAVIAALHWFGFVPDWRESGRNLLVLTFLIAAGLYCVFLIATPSLAKRSAATTVYAVTDRRLMILGSGLQRKARFFALEEIDDPRAMATASGQGAVIFIERKLPWWQRSAGGSYQIEGFYGISDAHRLAEEIQRLKAVATGEDMPDDG